MGNRLLHLKGFTNGLLTGGLASTVFIIAVIYTLNMTEVIIFSIPHLPDIHQAMLWVYDNLRLSLVAFVSVLILYLYHLRKLKRLLATTPMDTNAILQTEHLVEIWSSLFFGIGVIWTAIGMRSALLTALGGLDAATAAEEGAFAILQRLVDGGILLSLSTTIFGGVGGYLMRVYKTLSVGTKMQAFYTNLQQKSEDDLHNSLNKIEQQLILLNSRFSSQRNETPENIDLLPEAS